MNCPVCSKLLSSKYAVTKHLQTVHQLDADGKQMELDELKCTAGRCSYTTTQKGDMKKHEQKCLYIQFDQEAVSMKAEFVKQYELLHNKFAMEKQNLLADFALERQQFATHLNEYSQIISKQQVEIDMLRRHLDKAYEQVDQTRQGMERIAEKAIARPTTI